MKKYLKNYENLKGNVRELSKCCQKFDSNVNTLYKGSRIGVQGGYFPSLFIQICELKG